MRVLDGDSLSLCVRVYVCVEWPLTFTKYAYDKLIAIVGKGELMSG